MLAFFNDMRGKTIRIEIFVRAIIMFCLIVLFFAATFPPSAHFDDLVLCAPPPPRVVEVVGDCAV